MNISAKTEYACIAVLELAARYGQGKPVRIRDIAEANGIPSRFLVQILLQLKSAGIVGSTRGASGGYQLVKPPSEITLAEVMAVSDGQSSDPVTSVVQQSAASRTLMASWQNVAAVEREMLGSVTFSDLVDRAAEQMENMYYI
ncbi:MAG: Rrf2 family transcriptional regulator [Planctomycetaceae bacterium]|nr:Rrf2 family transcriptional regulator [Planctomycetales bacterium]MCB9874073.1 Rrf2 family transcriptional regulator [Planctomycetaceae bacterium]MCB9937673.1 Rrf2 family transcriptional regulator [Planctomycetaceae bacterium]HRX79543.1 Rrf2 family transcriptional regulator [Pirellulaceae bacterium]